MIFRWVQGSIQDNQIQLSFYYTCGSHIETSYHKMFRIHHKHTQIVIACITNHNYFNIYKELVYVP